MLEILTECTYFLRNKGGPLFQMKDKNDFSIILGYRGNKGHGRTRSLSKS
jgi:hypothetical protein